MSQLVNLVEYKQQLELEVQNANLTDCVLPESFKSKFTSFHGYNFEYYYYTLKVSTSQGECFIPNQWIFIGALCSQYHSELLKYKEKLVNYGITDDQFRRCHPGRDDKDIPEEERTQQYLQNLARTYLENYQNEDKELLINFLWDYDSWGGGKNINRGDFTASPVLSIAHSINASSGLIGIIAQALAEDQLLRQELFNSKEWEQLGRSNKTGINPDGTTHTYKSLPLQQIFYGAPGTGKSHTVNEITEKQPKDNVFRTTFHPDSDYATFVGCYKPTKEATSPLSLHKLHELYPEFKTKVENRPLHRFITKYYNSFRLLTEKEAESVFDKIETTSTVTAEVPKIMAAIEEIPTISSISYSFVPQSFTKAYLRAWQTEEPVYLVIEEINRGNCAQIFGDLFQLLDRKNGVSEYPIKADNDLATFIGEQLSTSTRIDIPKSVKNGEELMLPSNLYIWATMNTSDQSLFPIDSAFKRRWEWKYIKIANPNNIDWKIEGGHDWWEFLQQINAIIDKMTNSADKQLGYFFAKAKDDMISYDTFVSKICFYLWNDIFKTYALDEQQGDLFSYKDEEGQKKQLTFPAFYDGDGNVINAVVEAFINNVMNWNKKNDKD